MRSRNTSRAAESSPTEGTVPFRLESIEEADIEFLALPPRVREEFIAAFREIAVSDSPIPHGPGWYSEELRQRQRIAPEGLFTLHDRDQWRGVHFRRGDSLVFIAFGFRLPEFYDKLKRLRKAVSDSARSSRVRTLGSHPPPGSRLLRARSGAVTCPEGVAADPSRGALEREVVEWGGRFHRLFERDAGRG